jgi:AGCS family alanine or glycine:cation symporter
MLDILNDLIWSKILIIMLIGLGLYFTIASRFVQFRYFSNMFNIFGEAFQRTPGQISSFQALMLSVAGRVGAGNIAGGLGAAILMGVKRGLFSNEAGLGSAPNVAAVAEVKHPVAQGIVQSFSVFIDTIILCTCTALIILLSGVYPPGMEQAGVVLTQTAVASVVGEWGRIFITVALYYYLGENALSFFSQKRAPVMIYRGLVVALVFGAQCKIWQLFLPLLMSPWGCWRLPT